MLPKSVIACLAAAACVATTALMPTVPSAGRGGPMYGDLELAALRRTGVRALIRASPGNQ
jgi:hypothetical protein